MIERQTALRALIAGGVMLAAAPAAAQEGILFQDLMRAMNLFGTEKPDIDYRERPPLVVPPAASLPQPQARGDTRNAAWPNDPDVAAKRAALANARVPATERERYRTNQRPLLSQEEIRRGRIAGGENPGPAPGNARIYEEIIGPIVIGKELAARQFETDLRNLSYGSEPTREYLFEPPSGYRRPAGSAPLGPGADAPRVDQSKTEQKEFAAGTVRR